MTDIKLLSCLLSQVLWLVPSEGLTTASQPGLPSEWSRHSPSTFSDVDNPEAGVHVMYVRLTLDYAILAVAVFLAAIMASALIYNIRGWCFLLDPAVRSTEQERQSDYAELSSPPVEIHGLTRLKVEFSCTAPDKVAGVTLSVSTPLDQFGEYSRHFYRAWRCNGHQDAGRRMRRIRLNLADDIGFRPSVFNPNATVVVAAKLFTWIIDESTWSKADTDERREIYKRALVYNAYVVRIAGPYSRPHKMFPKSCVPWFWHHVQKNWHFTDLRTCPVELQTVHLLRYPAVLSGLTYGISRDLKPFSDTLLETERRRAFLSPSFSVELWVYIIDYCPKAHLNQAMACAIFVHITWLGYHMTPALLVDTEGKMQVEIQGPEIYTAHKTAQSLPLNQWVRILLTLKHREWSLHWSYGQHHNLTNSAYMTYDLDIAYDDTDGQFILGGVDPALGSFRGYLGQVKLYRGHALTLDELSLPDTDHPMFQLHLTEKEARCQRFLSWMSKTMSYYAHKAVLREQKYVCPYSYKWVMIGKASDIRLTSCPQRMEHPQWDHRHVARLMRPLARLDQQLTVYDKIHFAQVLMKVVTTSVKLQGLEQMHRNLPLLNQATCLGSVDAMFTLAVFLNNGLGTTVQETESTVFLMLGTLNQHRLSALALGHRHMMGIDGVPYDCSAAYMYYKFVGDTTRDDRETHNEEEVATEMVRLIDEVTMEQQTDENGDLFLWLKHQAQKGVQSAQLQMGHLLFWGSQGVRRNLQAAREMFQQGAEQGDPNSIYNLGLMEFHGKAGTEKNETAGHEKIKTAAEKGLPHAVGALGWIALEKERNYSKAAAYFEESYNTGHMDAGYYIGHMYHYGIYPNKSQDYDAAVNYYLWSALRGHLNAALLYAHMRTRGTPNLPRSIAEASEWARFIAEKNSVVGSLLRSGLHAYRQGDVALAVFYYMMAADAGPEVASFNLAWLCEENKEGVTSMFSKECQWRHYNLSVHREPQFVDPYSYIKMGDYYWFGCEGIRNISMAAAYYSAAAAKQDPHALFNLAFMVEERADIPDSVWEKLDILPHIRRNVSVLMELYERCRESSKSEAFIPCSLALYRVWAVDLWTRYHIWVKLPMYVGIFVAIFGTAYLIQRCTAHQNPLDENMLQL